MSPKDQQRYDEIMARIQEIEKEVEAWYTGFEYDSEFDAGEFSGPALGRAVQKLEDELETINQELEQIKNKYNQE